MAQIDDLPPLRDVIQNFGLEARRSLGQNFLLDLNLTSRIARSAGPLEGRTVLEIGPGPGGLTRALLAAGATKIIAIERDPRCIPALAQISERYPGRLTVIEGDALEIDPRPYLEGRPTRIVANLPYNIGTALLIGWVRDRSWPPFFESLTLMFQREVAERIVATPRKTDDYGRLGVLCGWRSNARILFDVPPTAFSPAPKVMSSVVELIPKATPLPCTVRMLETLTAEAFGQRRKMLRQSLKRLGQNVAGGAHAVLETAGIDETRRPETLEVEEFVMLANAFEAAGCKPERQLS